MRVVATLWGVAATGHVAALAPHAHAAESLAAHGELAGSGAVTVEIAGNVERSSAGVAAVGGDGRAAVYGGKIRFAALDGRLRIISEYDGATGPTNASIASSGGWRRELTAPKSAGAADGASQQRIEVDVLRRGADYLSAYGRHCAAGQRFRLPKDGLAPDAEGIGYGLDMAYDALSLHFGHERFDRNVDGLGGAPTVNDRRDVLKATLSLTALRAPGRLAHDLVPASVEYGHTDRDRTSFDGVDGEVTSRLGNVTDEIFLNWRLALGTTRLGVTQTASRDLNGPAGGSRALVIGETLAGKIWRAALRLDYGSRTAPHAATPWRAQIVRGRLKFALKTQDMPEISAGLDVAHFDMSLSPAKRGNDWRLNTSIDFSRLVPKPARGSSRLRLTASIGRGTPYAPAPETVRQLDGTLRVDASFRF